MWSCLATMPTELCRFFKYSTVYRYPRISILNALLTCEACFTFTLYVCKSVYPHNIEHVALREQIKHFYKIWESNILENFMQPLQFKNN
jgi:hypothetical protein